MHSHALVAAFAFGANALVATNSQCCFQLTANGGPGGLVGQLPDGQNRIGQKLPPATYCIGDNGGITDGNGRGCILTPPTTQFQCDQGAAPTPGFKVGCDGNIQHDGTNEDFFACPTGDNGGYNIYTRPPAGQQGCVRITLNTGGKCLPNCAPPPPPPPPPPPKKQCPLDLPTDQYQYPHLIVAIDSTRPDTALGNSYNATLTPSISTIFNFDVPASYAGKQCSVEFSLPRQDQLTTSSYRLSGPSRYQFVSLSGPATQGTTYRNAPAAGPVIGTATIAPGSAYVAAPGPCAAGQTIAIEMRSVDGTDLSYFQDYNPCPIGLYYAVQTA